jgi:hypothetical protein
MAYEDGYTLGKNVDGLFNKTNRGVICAEGPEGMGSPIAIHSGTLSSSSGIGRANYKG